MNAPKSRKGPSPPTLTLLLPHSSTRDRLGPADITGPRHSTTTNNMIVLTLQWVHLGKVRHSPHQVAAGERQEDAGPNEPAERSEHMSKAALQC